MEVLNLVPVGSHAELLEGEQTNTVRVRLHWKCGIVCLLCFLLGRWGSLKDFIRHHEADPLWSVAVPRLSWLGGHGSRYVTITYKQSSHGMCRGRPKLVGTMDELMGGFALRKSFKLPQM